MSDKKNIYLKSNYLIQAKYNLTSMEQKVLQLALSKIDQKDDDLKTYILYVSEFIKKSQDDNSEIYNHIAEAVRRLMKRSLTFVTMEGNLKEFNWVSYAQYFKDDKSKKNYELVKSVYELFEVYPDVKNAPAFMIYFIGEGNIITKEQIAKYKTIRRGGFEQRNYTKKDFKDLEKKLLGRED